MATSIADLVGESKLVAIIRITSEEARLIDDGRGIGTFYKFDVISVLKGAVANSDIDSIELPGGTYVYKDKSMAVIEVTKRPRLRVGYTYFVFCSPSSTSPQILEPSFESQGIFELSDDGVTVRHYSMEPGDQIRSQYNDEPEKQLLSDVMDVISKEKHE
ncbi:MAG: hypothetical protein ABSB30_02595 [Terracidiphilus sp.]